MEQEIIKLKKRLDIVESALLHIVNALDEKKQTSLRDRIKKTSKS